MQVSEGKEAEGERESEGGWDAMHALMLKIVMIKQQEADETRALASLHHECMFSLCLRTTFLYRAKSMPLGIMQLGALRV